MRNRQIRAMDNPTLIELAYIAGIFDGEGTVCIHIQAKKRIPWGTHTLQIAVANTNRNVIDFIVKFFPRKISIQRSRNPKWRTAFRWSLSGKRASDFLKMILPFLIIKKNQAVLGIQFEDNKRSFRGMNSGGRKPASYRRHIPKQELDFREKCRIEMQKLNRPHIVEQAEKIIAETNADPDSP